MFSSFCACAIDLCHLLNDMGNSSEHISENTYDDASIISIYFLTLLDLFNVQ